MSIASLGYVGLRVADPAAWANFACQRLGLMQGAASEDGTRLRLDSRDWRIALHAGPENDLAYVGFEVATGEVLAGLEQRLSEAGLPAKRGDAALLAARGASELVLTQDPTGLPVELACGLKDRGDVPFRSPAGTSGFVTGEQGLGHLVISAPEIAAHRRFYGDVLGMHLSDRIALGPILLEFYHCNPRHHTLALLPLPTPRRLHHLMFETASLDDVGFALDRCIAGGERITMSLGKHTNDHMVSFYVATPAGFDVEYGWGGIAVDDATWRVGHYDKISFWGHQRSA